MDNNNTRPQAPAEEQPQRRRKKKRNGCLSAFLYLFMIFILALICSAVAICAANDVFAFVKDDVPTILTVSSDTTVMDISKQLDKEGVINYSSLFKLFVKITKKDTNVLAGDYLLNPSMDYNAIIRKLKTTESDNTVTVTIPEGYTIQQIKEALISHHVCDNAGLTEALNTYQYNYDFLKNETMQPGWLEGYLFPDTYQFYVNDNAIDVVDKMLKNFANKYDENISDGATDLGRSIHDIVTIAAMVEREAQKDEEFEIIAGVIYNRLNNSSEFPYLQIDATLQYAVGHKDELTAADLELDTPYNTSKYKGLPPGPIANPGYTALYAASHPASHGYYYYVAMPDGSHKFAKTLSEHNANIVAAKQAFLESGT